MPCALRVGEPGEHALEHADDLRQRRACPTSGRSEPRGEVLHRDVRHAVVLEEVEHRDDVRMVERAAEARLVHEALRRRRVVALEVAAP